MIKVRTFQVGAVNWVTGLNLALVILCVPACEPTRRPPPAATAFTRAVAIVPTPSPTVSSTFTPAPTSRFTPIPPPGMDSTPSPFPTASPSSTSTPTPAPTQTPTFEPTKGPAEAKALYRQPSTKAVVLVVIDGARWTETFGDPTRELVPHLANDLVPLGAINTAFYNDGQTLSVPGHAAIVTGTWQDIPNNGQARPTAPTIFEYYRAATGASEDDAVFVHGSFIEPVLTYSSHPAYGAKFGARQFFSDYPAPPYDDGMRANTRRVLTELKPHLLMVSLLDPDEAGHSRNWEDYRRFIKHDDEIIWELWQQLQGDAFYAGQTTLIVTNDHGRGCGDGWPEHGGDDECNRHLMLLAVGPDIQPGLVITQRRTLRDIAPTIGYLLGFDTPLAEGEVMTELLVQ
ncbi:MAG: alkaline phosphatase family protein [Anaerolineae bacterium]|nr:alkaline phosphatase family protein [Anaerolineae bacterium]